MIEFFISKSIMYENRADGLCGAVEEVVVHGARVLSRSISVPVLFFGRFLLASGVGPGGLLRFYVTLLEV